MLPVRATESAIPCVCLARRLALRVNMNPPRVQLPPIASARSVLAVLLENMFQQIVQPTKILCAPRVAPAPPAPTCPLLALVRWTPLARHAARAVLVNTLFVIALICLTLCVVPAPPVQRTNLSHKLALAVPTQAVVLAQPVLPTNTSRPPAQAQRTQCARPAPPVVSASMLFRTVPAPQTRFVMFVVLGVTNAPEVVIPAPSAAHRTTCTKASALTRVWLAFTRPSQVQTVCACPVTRRAPLAPHLVALLVTLAQPRSRGTLASVLQFVQMVATVILTVTVLLVTDPVPHVSAQALPTVSRAPVVPRSLLLVLARWAVQPKCTRIPPTLKLCVAPVKWVAMSALVLVCVPNARTAPTCPMGAASHPVLWVIMALAFLNPHQASFLVVVLCVAFADDSFDFIFFFFPLFLTINLT